MKKLIYVFLGLSLGCANPEYLDDTHYLPQGSDSISCAQRIANICTDIIWNQGPSSQGESRFHIQFDSELPESAVLEVILWMPSMNHGSAPVTVKRISNSSFEASKVFFIMPGDWEVRILLKDSSGSILGRHTLEFILP